MFRENLIELFERESLWVDALDENVAQSAAHEIVDDLIDDLRARPSLPYTYDALALYFGDFRQRIAELLTELIDGYAHERQLIEACADALICEVERKHPHHKRQTNVEVTP